MENATKALMIAAAVLVAILIISLGIGIFTSASEQMGDMDMSEYQIQQFNEKFTRYVGEKKSGTDVNALITTVFNHNMAQEDKTMGVQLIINADSTVSGSKATMKTSAKSPIADVSSAKVYKVTPTYNTKTGLITKITVSQPT